MTTYKKIEVQVEDPVPNKWCVPLKDDVFSFFMAKGNSTFHKFFGDGSLFSPLLFGKYFDPSDAFPLWDFESDILLTGQTTVDWFETDTDYVLRAELPAESEKNEVQICIENGKVAEITGKWKHQSKSETKDWKSNQWWEHGYVRRLELPENADWRNIEACVMDDILLEIRISKSP